MGIYTLGVSIRYLVEQKHLESPLKPNSLHSVREGQPLRLFIDLTLRLPFNYHVVFICRILKKIKHIAHRLALTESCKRMLKRKMTDLLEKGREKEEKMRVTSWRLI